MKNSAYWNSQYNYYMTHQPPKAESYYNQSFVDKMNEAQKNIDNLVAEIFFEVGHNLQPFGECEGIAYFYSVYIISYRIAYLFCSI